MVCPGGKKNAEIMVGFRSFLKKNEIKKRGVNGTIAGALKKHKSKKGDCYFVPAGTVHTMGAGNLVFEVQQNSDITYRLYDWDRMNLGVRRELHIDWAVDSIKHSEKAGKCGPKPRPGMREIRINTLVSCDYFTVSEGRVERKIKYWYNENSPAVFTVINGNMRVSAKDSGGYFFKKGDVVFFPRAFSDAVVTFSKGARFLITEIN